jgi:hypothetical protein
MLNHGKKEWFPQSSRTPDVIACTSLYDDPALCTDKVCGMICQEHLWLKWMQTKVSMIIEAF